MVFPKRDCKRISSLPFNHVRKAGFGIHCGLLRQLYASQVRAGFEQVFVSAFSYKAMQVVSP